MKYNYLEQYNLIQILQEAGLGVNFSDFKDIEKSIDVNILNPIKDGDIDDLTIEDFNLFISGKKIIQKELNLDIAYLFFYNKLFIVKISGDEIPSIVFSSSPLFSEYEKNNKDNFEDFKEKLETIDFESYSNYSRIKHEDSKEFWKYIIICLKIFIKEGNVNVFQFTGSASSIASKARLRQTNNLLITKQIQNFHTLLYLNLDKVSNINNSFKKIQIKKILKKYKNQLISSFNMLYEPFKVKINNKLESQFAIIRKAIEKQIEVNKSFEDKKDLQKLIIKMDDLLDNKDLIIKNTIKIHNIIELEKKLPIYNDEKDEKEFNDNEEFDSKEYLKLLNITKDSEDAIIYLNNLDNLKQIKKSLAQDFIKRFEMLLNNIIKKYKLDRNIIRELIEIKNSLIPEFEDVNSYKVIKRENFAKILTETLQEVSDIEKTFTLHEDYKNRLELYIKSISDKVFKNKSNFLNFIEELKFDPQYSYLDFKKLPDPIECIGWLLSYTEEGKMALMNAREKRYYNILINDLGIPKKDITFKYGDIIFKI
jgi:hypothetical protein